MSDPSAEGSGGPHGPLLDNHTHFRDLLAAEIGRCRAFRRSFALLLFRSAGPNGAPLSLSARRLARHLRPFDRLSLYQTEAIEVLLPETDETEARQIAERLLEKTRAAGVDSTLYCAIGVFPQAGDSSATLIDGCRRALRQACADRPICTPPRPHGRAPWPRRLFASPDAPMVASPAMKQVYATVARLAHSLIPVLLNGETGSGKEVVARAIHERGPRATKRMVSLNCGAIPATLVESVLFGHERGAFTGAVQQSQGVLEQADGGTVLLDEVGELALPAQAALLRALDTKRVRRVGASSEVPINVRLIAATHRDLEQMCRAGRFRWDLYYRLNGFLIDIPPLRKRPEDIAPLAEVFVHKAAAENGTAVPDLDADAIATLERFSWPGNVRELRNAMEHAVVLAAGSRITVAELPQKLIDFRDAEHPPADDSAASSPSAEALHPSPDPDERPADAAAAGDSPVLGAQPEPADSQGQRQPSIEREIEPGLRVAVRRYEARLILHALRQADWNRTRAAKRLGVSVRTLANKIKSHGIKQLGYGLSEDEPPELS